MRESLETMRECVARMVKNPLMPADVRLSLVELVRLLGEIVDQLERGRNDHRRH